MPLSHNFWEQAKGCTTYGETHRTRSKFFGLDHQFLLSYCRRSALPKWMPGFSMVFAAIRLDGRPSILAITRTAAFGATRSLPASPNWIPSSTFDILNTCHIGEDFRQETGAHFYAQAHISTQPASPLKDARLSLTYEDQVGSCRAEPSPCSRPQARLSQRRLSRLSHSRRFVFGWSRFQSLSPSGRNPSSLR
jgi:hypothetical protein